MDDHLTLDSWVTADQHWGHPNIGLYQGRPDDHMEIMRERWVSLVKEDDVLLHLGDIVCFGDRARHLAWLGGLPGRKFLLRGNHDKYPSAWYAAAGFIVVGRGPICWVRPDDGEVICFSHGPERDVGGWDVNVHGHIHGNGYWPDDRDAHRRVNVCVEKTCFAPVRLRAALARG